MISIDASVVIPTYNRQRTLERTVNALLSQRGAMDTFEFEIVIVDDSSSDDTQEYMKNMSSSIPYLTYIRHDENQGRAVTRNDGIKAACGDIVIFLDDDNVPDQAFVEAHLRYHKQDENEHIAVMGNTRFAPEITNGSNIGKYLQSRYLGCRSPKDLAGIDYSDLPARCFGTLNCSARKADLLAVGMFDTGFRFYGGEDVYLGYSLKKLGARIIFGQDARSLHYDEVSISRYKAKMLATARGGHWVILSKGPDYFENTQLRFLLPIDWRRDSLKRATTKLGIRALLNPAVVFALEKWATLTDRFSWLYSQPLYRLLAAGWILQGYRSKQQEQRLVTYGSE